jgi:hypothetical protein
MSFFLLIFSFIIFSGLIYSLIFEKSLYFSFFCTIYILLYDYTFVLLKYEVPPSILFLFKSWQEIIILFSIIRIVARRKRLESIDIIVISLAILGTALGVFYGNKNFDVFKGLRLYMGSILAFLLLFRSGIFDKIDLKLVFNCIIFVCTISSIYSIYLDSKFLGDLRILWFYDFVDSINPIEIARFNYIRDDKLRASGFFISPLIQSTLLGLVSLYLLVSCLSGAEQKNLVFKCLLLAVNLYGIYLCRTRIGTFILAIGLILAFGVVFYDKLKYFHSFGFTFFLIFVTFFSLLFGLTSDPSALGRIPQYLFLKENFQFFGFGFGHPSTLTVFDSMFVSAALALGVFSAFYFIIPIGICFNLDKIKGFLSKTNDDSKIRFAVIYGFSFSILYMFAFQFTLGSASMHLFYFLSFAVILNLSKSRDSAPNTGLL